MLINSLKPLNTEIQHELSREKIALHEAAHGIVWYLFREYWNVNRLTVDRDKLSDVDNQGELHITANFDVNSQNNIERVNELFTIALAGMIGQNIERIIQDKNIIYKITTAPRFDSILDIAGCSGDFDIATKYVLNLKCQFGIENFTKFRVMDLIGLFQDEKVQKLHLELANILLEKGSMNSNQLGVFFDENNFQDYITSENLYSNFVYLNNG